MSYDPFSELISQGRICGANQLGTLGATALQAPNIWQQWLEYAAKLRRETWRQSASQGWLNVMIDIELGVWRP